MVAEVQLGVEALRPLEIGALRLGVARADGPDPGPREVAEGLPLVAVGGAEPRPARGGHNERIDLAPGLEAARRGGMVVDSDRAAGVSKTFGSSSIEDASPKGQWASSSSGSKVSTCGAMRPNSSWVVSESGLDSGVRRTEHRVRILGCDNTRQHLVLAKADRQAVSAPSLWRQEVLFLAAARHFLERHALVAEPVEEAAHLSLREADPLLRFFLS